MKTLVKFLLLLFITISNYYCVTAQKTTKNNNSVGVLLSNEEVPLSVQRAFANDFGMQAAATVESWEIVMPHTKTMMSLRHNNAPLSPKAQRILAKRAEKDAKLNTKKEELLAAHQRATDSKEREKLFRKMQKLAEKQAWSVKPIKFPKESGRSKRGSSRGGSTSKTAIEYSTTDADALFPDQQQLIFRDRDNKLPQYVGYANDGTHFYIYDVHGNLVYSEETLSDWAQIPEAASLHFRERFPTAYTEATLFKISYGAKDAAKTQVFRLKAKGKNYYYAADGIPISDKETADKSGEKGK